MLAWAPQADGPIMYQKLDIKDGYWRGVVEEEAKWNFCYVLPKLHPDEPTMLVVPKCLQMGWTESPAYFCVASESARDIAEDLAKEPVGSLPKHALEDLTLSNLKTELAKLPV